MATRWRVRVELIRETDGRPSVDRALTSAAMSERPAQELYNDFRGDVDADLAVALLVHNREGHSGPFEACTQLHEIPAEDA